MRTPIWDEAEEDTKACLTYAAAQADHFLGIAEALGRHYGEALIRHLAVDHGYAGRTDADRWRQRVRVLDDPPVDPLWGAQVLADGGYTIRRADERRDA